MTLTIKSKNKSFEALVARKVDSGLAQSLLDSGHTLSSLSQMPKADLSKLSISAEAITYIHAHRPRIPSEVFNSVLFKSRWTC